VARPLALAYVWSLFAHPVFSFFFCSADTPLFPYTTLFRSLPRDCNEAFMREASRVADELLLLPLCIEELKLRIGRILDRRSGCEDRKSTRLNSSHQIISYAVFCLKKKKTTRSPTRGRSCEA